MIPIWVLALTLLAPGTVSDLRASALTDTSVVLTWTEVSSGTTTIARYLIRYGPAELPLPAQPPFLVTGGCGAPVYGSTPSGGQTRSCVLGGLLAQRIYVFQVIAYTGTLSTTGNWGGWSNRAETTTATRVGPMLIVRPRMFLDSLTITAASIADYGATRFPLRGTFPLGDRVARFYDSTGAVVGVGYVLVSRP